MIPFSIYSSAIKYNKSFVESLRLGSDNQSKFKKNQQQAEVSKNIYKLPCVFSNLKINDWSLYYISLLIINQLLVNV